LDPKHKARAKLAGGLGRPGSRGGWCVDRVGRVRLVVGRAVEQLDARGRHDAGAVRRP
jgi:hypothetical protein